MKKIFISVFCCITALIAVYNLNISFNNSSYGSFNLYSLASIEALASEKTTCYGDPNKNTGVCKATANNTGDVCVVDNSSITFNCYDHG